MTIVVGVLHLQESDPWRSELVSTIVPMDCCQWKTGYTSSVNHSTENLADLQYLQHVSRRFNRQFRYRLRSNLVFSQHLQFSPRLICIIELCMLRRGFFSFCYFYLRILFRMFFIRLNFNLNFGIDFQNSEWLYQICVLNKQIIENGILLIFLTFSLW